MKKVVLYAHSGSENHGCEALLRTTVNLVDRVEKVYSNDDVADIKYEADSIIPIRKIDIKNYGLLRLLLFKVCYKLKPSDKLYFRLIYSQFIKEIDRNKIYLSIGGDNYCYHYNCWLEVLNKAINKRGAKTVLWGCSINEDAFEDDGLLEDLNMYSLITARETLTVDLLKKHLPQANIKYVPDTAFLLETQFEPLPNKFEKGNTIGLNISPVVLGNDQGKEQLFNWVLELINYIINNTNYQIALIPHVVIENNDDRMALKKLYNECHNQNRLCLIQDANCMVLKGYIARCEMFIGARTHATIAAYSSCVPTMVLGYSIKSKGIAKDLFGTYEKYVLPIEEIEDKQQLIQAFNWLDSQKQSIKEHLQGKISDYISKIYKANAYLEEL